MKNDHEQVATLRQQAADLPNGQIKVALLEDAVRRADSLKDPDLSFDTRIDLLVASSFAGRPDISLIAFAWCLAQSDRDPNRFSPLVLLWKYKWIIRSAGEYPQIDKSRLTQMLADMERRYQAIGSTMHAVEYTRRSLMLEMGEVKLAKEANARFKKLRRDRWSDCPACVANTECWYQGALKQWKRAAAAAEPVIEGVLTCSSQPQGVLANVLLPLVHLGRIDEAKRYQKQGYRLISREPYQVVLQSRHITFLVLIGEMNSAKRLVEQHMGSALMAVVPIDRFAFYVAALLWIDRLLSDDVHQLKLRLPKELPQPLKNGKTDLHACRKWLLARASEIGNAFDARNGIPNCANEIAELADLLKLAKKLAK